MRRNVLPCLDCGIPTRSSRCSSCAEKRLSLLPQRPKANTTERGYGSDWQRTARLILDRDGWTCQICGKRLSGSDATVDHIVPLSKNKNLRLEPSNLRASCRSCNSRKSNK